jgi:hypothetical protein
MPIVSATGDAGGAAASARAGPAAPDGRAAIEAI